MGSSTAVAPVGPAGPAGPLDEAVAAIARRYGSQAVVRGGSFERRAGERGIATGTAIDRLPVGVAVGTPCVFAGPGTNGKLTLALRVAAGAQGAGAAAIWIDPTASLDACAAARAGVDPERLIVVRARSRDDALYAAAAGLRGGGSRIVVLDTGPALADPALVVDDAAPLLPIARGSQAALLLVSDTPPARLVLPVVRFALLDWERERERITGWTVAVAAAGERVALRLRAGGGDPEEIVAPSASLRVAA